MLARSEDYEEDFSMIRAVRLGALAAILTATAAVLPAAEETFTFDKNHTLVGFRIRHVVSKVEGRFRDFDGSITIDRQNPAASRVDLTIQATSIDTSAPDRDNHLRSADFFDVAKFPTLTFKSTKVEAQGSDRYLVTGDLAMHGVTKSIQVPVHALGFARTGKTEKAGFEISMALNRKDYGITWNRAIDQGMLLGDDVEINIQVEANKKEPEAAKPGGR
jgi:polyisoprenoid-binding protein YceI